MKPTGRPWTAVILRALLGIAFVCAAMPLGAYTLVLQNGQRVHLSEFRVLGPTLEGRRPSGETWTTDASAIDYQSTYLANTSETDEKGIYLSRGKILTFEKMTVEGDAAVLELGKEARIRVPLAAIDFRTTVIEGRGQRAGATYRPSRSSAGTARARRRSATVPSPPSSGASMRGGFGDRFQDNPDPDPPTPPVQDYPEGFEPVAVPEETNPFNDLSDSPSAALRGGDEEGMGEDGPLDTNRDRAGIYSPRRITRAEVVQKVDPIYDPSLVPEGRGVTALMEVTVGETGNVSNVKVIKSSGNPELDAAGVEAIQQYLYNPAEKDGVPFESRRLERISFRGQ